MQQINLDELREGFRGRPYKALVEHHLNSQSAKERVNGLMGTSLFLPSEARPLAEGFIDRWNQRAYDPKFWRADCAQVFDEIVEDARNILQSAGIPADDEALFNMFQIVTMSYAYSAEKEPKFREFAGIKKKSGVRKYAGTIVAGLGILVLVNLTDNPVILVAGWVLFGIIVWPVVSGLLFSDSE